MEASMYCGLDFGTSNTALAVLTDNGVTLAPVENGERTLPSAIFFDDETRAINVGRAAVAEYLAGQPGRLMRGLKSVLGSSLMEETTAVAGKRLSFSQIIATFVAQAKKRAEAHIGKTLTHVVHGRPVRFTTNEKADARAEAELESIARSVGFTDVSFQFEPIAAALTFEQTLKHETLALIADIGGGTSDFSVVRLGPERASHPDRAADVLANEGVRLGGTDLDTALSLARVMPAFGYNGTLQGGRLRTPNYLYVNLATWARINETYAPEAKREARRLLPQIDDPASMERLIEVMDHRHGHRIAGTVEDAKIALSEKPKTAVELGFVERGLSIPVRRDELELAIAEGMDRLSNVLRQCMILAGIAPSRIGAVVMTGGSTLLPAVRNAIANAVPEAALHDCDQFGAVATGLGLEAMRRYR